MAPGFHSARSFFGAGFRSTRDRSSGSWWRSKDGSGTVGGDGFGTEGDDDGGEDGRGRPGSRWPWKGGRRAVAAESVADFGPEEERYACVNLNARDAPPPVTPQVMRWAEDVRRERRESRVVGKLRLPPPVTTGVLKWAVEANERGEGTVLGPGLFRDLHYYRELRGSIWYIDARPRRSRGSDAKIRRRAGSAPSTPLGRARGRLRTVPEASNEEEGGRSRTGRRRGACRTRRGPLGGPVLAPKLRRYGAKAREKAERAGEDLDAFDAGNEDLEIALESIESRLAGIRPSPPATSGSGSTSGTGGVSTSKTVDPVLSKRFDRTSAYGRPSTCLRLRVMGYDGRTEVRIDPRYAQFQGRREVDGGEMELIDAVDKALANKDASNAEALKNASKTV
eukprot:jgi/Mesvir1/11026/Mv21443-RA.1